MGRIVGYLIILCGYWVLGRADEEERAAAELDAAEREEDARQLVREAVGDVLAQRDIDAGKVPGA